jgi:hypothetical protein
MFGHLKPEEFMNAMEGWDADIADLPKDRKEHLESCALCAAQFRSIEAARNELVMQDRNIPEPDWHEFRDSVRRELLSRSVQRASAVRRWTGWAIRPAMAWALSFALLLVVSVGGFIWHVRNDADRSTANRIQDGTYETPEFPELTAWTGTGVFQELSNLEEPQVERLQTLVESAQQGVLNRQ